jgi:hypothetical protein
VNGVTTKWLENSAYGIATTKCCQCVLLAYHDSSHDSDFVSGTGSATCIVLLTCGWKSVSSKQCAVKLTLLYSCCVTYLNLHGWFM